MTPVEPESAPSAPALKPGLSPASRGFILAFLLALAVFGLVRVMLLQPWAGFRFHADVDVLLVSSETLARPAAVAGLRQADGNLRPLPSWLIVEEPDFLDRISDYNALMHVQTPLLAEWRSGQAKLVLQDGRELPVVMRPRGPRDIPVIFWLQLGFGLIALGIGCGIWVFRPHQRVVNLLLLTAAGFAAGTWSASIYSSRELLMEPELFRLLSIINHGGALLFDCAMLALLWSYPRPLGRQPVAALALLLGLIAWVADIRQVADTFSGGFYLWLLVIFLMAAGCAWQQWRLSRRDPVSRMALRWLLLSFLLGSGAFVALQVVPLMLGVTTPVPQSLSSGVFLIVYLGLAAGISRYRLFRLEHWWLAAWSWLFGGILVLLVDGIAVWFLRTDGWMALSLAVGVAGWLYFPLRQWLVERLLQRGNVTRQLQAGAIRRLFDLPTDEALCAHWPDVVRSIFSPLAMERRDGERDFMVADNGLLLCLPDIEDGRHVMLSYCERGGRLFNRDDLDTARELYGIARHARDALAARQQGARLERDRIKRDLHDDLGARLLSILHGRQEAGMREEARLAIRDLRQMLATLDERSVTLTEAAQLMREEAAERLQRAGIGFVMPSRDWSGVMLSARQYANLKRMVRECITNAIKHSGASEVQLTMTLDEDWLCLTVSDNGRFDPAQLELGGRGHHIIHSRADELGGGVEWRQAAEGGCRVEIRIPVAVSGRTEGQGEAT
ncbi:MAG TPA: ATP-binding protein [Fluviicoccus sp.]|nr:ATP-binding protein [Fluviicoccus sp.]